MILEEVRTTHLESVDSFEAGVLDFQDFWSKQNNFLEQCEAFLRIEIEKLESLKVCKNDGNESFAIKAKKAIKKKTVSPVSKDKPMLESKAESGIVKDSDEKEKKDCDDKEKKDSVGKQTWSIGVLSSFLKKEEEIKKEKENDAPKADDKSLVCSECKAKFVNHNRVLKDHIESAHLKMKYYCKECGKGFRLRKLLFPHIKKESGIQSLRLKDPDSLMLQQCGSCPDAEKCSKDNILEHIKLKHPVFEEFYSKVSQASLQTKTSSTNGAHDDLKPNTVTKVPKPKMKPELKKIKKVADTNILSKKLKKNTEEIKRKEEDPNDLTSFISQIENNLERYSRIIDESTKETKGKKMKKIKKKKPGRRQSALKKEGAGMICKYCDLDFSEQKRKNAPVMLRYHVEREHMNMVYKCKKCDFESNKKIKMNDHVDENHIHQNVNKKELEKIRSDCIGYTCYECKDSFSKWSEVLSHTLKEHGDFDFNEIYPLKIRRMAAGKRSTMRKNYLVFTDPKFTTNLDNNTSAVSQGKLIKGPNKRLLRCPLCRFNTSTYLNLKVHFVTHLGAKFTCTLCNLNYKTKFDAMEHVKNRHSDKAPGNRKWIDTYIMCACEVCDFKGNPVESFDDHLVKEHKLPPPPPPTNGK